MEKETIEYSLVFTKRAEKELSRLAGSDIKRLLAKIEQLSSPFTAPLDIKKLSSIQGYYRLRVESMRVIFEIDQEKREVWIRSIGYRGNMY